MLPFLSILLLYIAQACAQVPTYGPTPLPFGRTTLPGTFTPAVPTTLPTVPTVAPSGFPFGNTPRPIPPLAPGYNNYYTPNGGPAIPILTYSNNPGPEPGSYSFSYTSADGKQVQESGFLKDAFVDNNGEPQGTQVVQGSYSYISPDGTPVQVSYIADENGFRPSGVHIPADGKALPPPLIDPLNKDKLLDPFNRFDPYNRHDPHNRYDPYNRDPYNRDPYNRDPYNRDPYNRDLYNRDPYNRDPYNRYDRNRFNNPYNRPYDSRNPYDPTKYDPYNPYRQNGYLNTLNKAKEETKKKTS